MQELTIETPTGLLQYTITHRPRVTKRLHMELDENGGLVVVAPRHWSQKHIRTTLSRNTSRVERFLVRARERQLKPLCHVNGELHYYLGERYPLSLKKGVTRKTTIVLEEDKMHIQSSDCHSENIRKVLQAWYHKRALEVFSTRLKVVAARAGWVGSRPVPLKLRRMKRTWGNCSSRGVVKLNTHLIKAPLPIIDSVIAHELCHLREMNHGKAFYTLLEQLNPNWRQDRLRLRSEGNLYLL
jgi:predicted metal-dependent hydrolase